jgi:hypothetical protein
VRQKNHKDIKRLKNTIKSTKIVVRIAAERGLILSKKRSHFVRGLSEYETKSVNACGSIGSSFKV